MPLPKGASKQEIAQQLAYDIAPGSYVNLGIGLPTLVADFLSPSSSVVLHTENGMLRMGPQATGDQIDPELINAGKIPVTELEGASYFHQADSFAMIRGGHIDLCVLGAFQVSFDGDLANWHGGEPNAIPSVGGAMDLAAGAKDIYVIMTLFDRSGNIKLVPECSYPLTGPRCVSRVYCEFGVIELVAGRKPRVLRSFVDDDNLLTSLLQPVATRQG